MDIFVTPGAPPELFCFFVLHFFLDWDMGGGAFILFGGGPQRVAVRIVVSLESHKKRLSSERTPICT